MNKTRDLFLDYTKGIAILIVVIGHTFQTYFSDFDSLFWFRLIYSFHMPLFVILSGASASFWVNKFNGFKSINQVLHFAKNRILKSFYQLVIPFLAWTVNGYFIYHNETDFFLYIKQVFYQPDYSLWFLLVIFWSVVYTTILFSLISIIAFKFFKSESHIKYISEFKILIIFIIWFLFRRFLPSYAGLGFTNYFHNGLYFYFLFGLGLYKYLTKIRYKLLRFTPYLIFIPLVFYWNRQGSYNFMENIENLLILEIVQRLYEVIVAISGSLIVIDLSRIIYEFKKFNLRYYFCDLGKNTLGIYAIHTYFISVFPPILAPLIISRFLIYFICKNRYTRMILTGS